MAGHMRPTATFSSMNSNGWRRKGMSCFYPNPRGSTSYGQEFGNVIQYKYPGADFKDLMAGVDEVVRRGGIDEKKMGVTGGSGGGLLTNWVVGHTDRFAAAVAQRDIADWADWWYSADFTLFQPNWFKTAPFNDAGGRLQSALADYLHQQGEDSAYAGPRRRRQPHTTGSGWRADVSRAQVPQDSDGDGQVP